MIGKTQVTEALKVPARSLNPGDHILNMGIVYELSFNTSHDGKPVAVELVED